MLACACTNNHCTTHCILPIAIYHSLFTSPIEPPLNCPQSLPPFAPHLHLTPPPISIAPNGRLFFRPFPHLPRPQVRPGVSAILASSALGAAPSSSEQLRAAPSSSEQLRAAHRPQSHQRSANPPPKPRVIYTCRYQISPPPLHSSQKALLSVIALLGKAFAMDQLFNVPTRADCCTECDVYAPVSSNLLVESSAF